MLHLEEEMAKIPESIGSKYRFIILAAERAKQLQNNAKPKLKTRSTKPAFIAMRELEQDLLSFVITPPVDPSSPQS
jgi:DNA-directed RNA polymerase omega subunit